ncbi:hypothetical protein [Pantoea vagans]|uniref:hypothetical protein n=1 Tax=Pantoea vagans TaxID=470934 RepID=UPI003B01A483
MTIDDVSTHERWVDAVNRKVELGEGLEFSAAQLARQLNEPDIASLTAFLAKLVVLGSATEFMAYTCPMRGCQKTLRSGVDPVACPFCRVTFIEEGVTPTTEHFFRLTAESSRDIRWMVVIHGMNSRAPWQEAFSWEIANLLKYSAPVLIYKYGWATYEVLFPGIHRRMAKSLGRRIRIASGRARAANLPDCPDVIAHSFGTRLFSLVLEDPEFADLRFGRVITAGSIIRPDFDWKCHFQDGRVEAVLNHIAAKDGAVPFAVWAIPGTGPSGKVGYMSQQVLNIRNLQYGHSSFFEDQYLPALIGENGLWHSFFTRPLKPLRNDGVFVLKDAWQPPTTWQIITARVVGGITITSLVFASLWLLKLIMC